MMDAERKKIIIVDDNKTNLTAARNALIDTYDAFTVPSGEKLLTAFLPAKKTGPSGRPKALFL